MPLDGAGLKVVRPEPRVRLSDKVAVEFVHNVGDLFSMEIPPLRTVNCAYNITYRKLYVKEYDNVFRENPNAA